MNWKNKKVLVTGADGFIGSHLTEYLVDQGAKVKAFVYYNSFNSWGWLDHSPKTILDNLEIFTGDIRDSNGVSTALQGCEYVFHLAALIGIPFSYHSPDSYVDTNIKGTLNVLQAAKNNDVKKVLHTSTSEIYGTAQYVPIDEKHPINPQSPYAATKSGADELALSFYRSFELPVTIARPFNTFGPRQSARAIIPTIMSQLADRATKVKLGNISATRDFNYVANTVDGFIRLAEAETTEGEIFNLGSGVETSIEELFQTICSVMNVKAEIELDEQRLRPEKSEVERLLCNAEKVHAHCQWAPRVSLEEGLQKTWDWFQSNKGQYKSEIYNI